MNTRSILFVLLVVITPSVLIGGRLWHQYWDALGPSRGSGVIEGTEITLSSRVSARVIDEPVHEGQQVAKGDLLVQLDCTDPQAQLDAATARLAFAEAQAAAAAAQADAAERSAGAARQSSQAGQAQVAAYTTQHDVAAAKVGRLDAQSADVAAESLEQAHGVADQLASQMTAAKAQAAAGSLQAQAASSQVEAARSSAEAAKASVEAAKADLLRAQTMVGECEVHAPQDAIVETLPWDRGEMVPAGAAAVVLVDLTTVKVTFYLPDAELASAKPGAPALIVADAYPDREFNGAIRTVATAAEFTPRNVQTRTDRDRLVFPVEVAIPNPGALLRPGMPVDLTLPGTQKGHH